MNRDSIWVGILKISAYILLVGGIIASFLITYESGGSLLITLIIYIPIALVVPAAIMVFLNMAIDISDIRNEISDINRNSSKSKVSKIMICSECDREYSNFFDSCPHCKHHS